MLTPEQEDRLEQILQMADSATLTQWERDFLKNLAERYEEQGERTFISPKMWDILLRVETKMQRENL